MNRRAHLVFGLLAACAPQTVSTVSATAVGTSGGSLGGSTLVGGSGTVAGAVAGQGATSVGGRTSAGSSHGASTAGGLGASTLGSQGATTAGGQNTGGVGQGATNSGGNNTGGVGQGATNSGGNNTGGVGQGVTGSGGNNNTGGVGQGVTTSGGQNTGAGSQGAGSTGGSGCSGSDVKCNGVCTDTSDDPDNCGACNVVCDTPPVCFEGAGSCVSSVCVYQAVAAGTGCGPCEACDDAGGCFGKQPTCVFEMSGTTPVTTDYFCENAALPQPQDATCGQSSGSDCNYFGCGDAGGAEGDCSCQHNECGTGDDYLSCGPGICATDTTYCGCATSGGECAAVYPNGGLCCNADETCLQEPLGSAMVPACCPTAQVCGSTCCSTGYSCCGGACVDTSTDSNNCGGCGALCNAPPVCFDDGGTCVASKCQYLNFTDAGTDCDTCKSCDGNGSCTPKLPVCVQYPGSPDVATTYYCGSGSQCAVPPASSSCTGTGCDACTYLGCGPDAGPFDECACQVNACGSTGPPTCPTAP